MKEFNVEAVAYACEKNEPSIDDMMKIHIIRALCKKHA